MKDDWDIYDEDLKEQFEYYQECRRDVLSKVTQSEFIESLILNVDIPTIIPNLKEEWNNLTTQGVIVAVEYETPYNFHFYLNVSPIDKHGTRITIHDTIDL
jgi:hypothetical protein